MLKAILFAIAITALTLSAIHAQTFASCLDNRIRLVAARRLPHKTGRPDGITNHPSFRRKRRH